MHTNPDHEQMPEEVDASKGYEASDVRVSGILVFLTAMAVFGIVTALLVYGIGKVLNTQMARQDGPVSRWSHTVDLHDLGRLPSSPELESRYAAVTQQYPTPRLQNDDGNQDLVELHAREDLLLDHYSWVDASKGKVRIPIDRAMDLLTERGLAVVPVKVDAKSKTGASSKAVAMTDGRTDVEIGQPPLLLTGDERPVVSVRLTNGFARTGYEQELARQTADEPHPQPGK